VLAAAWRQEGPNVVIVNARLAMFAPTHLSDPSDD
jgi:hypothetical protein